MSQQQIINVGAEPDDGQGDPLRTAFIKTNQNFTTLFSTAGVTGIANGTSNISIPVANGSVLFAIGNTANILTVRSNGVSVTGNADISQYVLAGNVLASGVIVANGTIQSLGAVTAVTVSASGNLVGGNINIINQLRASTLSLTGNVVGAELNITGNVAAANALFNGNLEITGSNIQAQDFSVTQGNITAAGNVLTISGFSVNSGNIQANGAANLAGNVNAPYFVGNGSQLFGITAAPANIFNIIEVTGSPVVVADSPNDTLRFTYGNNITITGNAITDTVNWSFADSPTFNGVVTSTNFVGDLKGTVVADDSTIMVDAVDNKLFAIEMSATGNVTASYFLGNGALLSGIDAASIQDGTTNLRVVSSGGNIAANVGGTANVLVLSSVGAFVTGDISATGNLTINGNVTYVNVDNLNVEDPIIGIGRGANDTPLTTNDGKDRGEQLWYYSGSEKSAFIGYDNSNSKLMAAANVTIANEVVTVADYGNIVLGNIEASGTISATANITAPYFLGNVLGNVSGPLVVAGGNRDVLFNDSGLANSTAGFTFDKATNVVSVTGNVVSTGNISATYFLGNGACLTGVITSVANINNGTTNLRIDTSGGNIAANIGGTANVLVLTTAGGEVTGTVSVSGNITAGNIDTGGLITATGNITSSANLSGLNIATAGNVQAIGNVMAGAANITGNISGGNIIISGVVTATGNITGGNLVTAGIITVNAGNAATAIVNGGGNAVGNIGSESNYFNRVFATSTSALYADLAEYFLADARYETGTVMVLGGPQEVTTSSGEQDPRVVGVVSDRPSYVMNTGLQGEFATIVALTGRVPCRVIGPIHPGDLLMTSPRPGHACAVPPDMARPGHVFAKAINQYLSSEPGVIEVVVGLR